MTAVADSVFTAAQFNTYVRDNLLETAPAKATTAGNLIVTDGVNSVKETGFLDDVVETAQTTTSTSYNDLATIGPEITMDTGPFVMVWINTRLSNTTTTGTWASFEVSGVTTSAAIDGRAIISATSDAVRMGVCTRIAVTPGVNTFTMKYRVSAGTGTFTNRRIQVLSL